jgi:hypothetical protein
MIAAVDEVLRQLLIREIPIKENEVDIAFDQPRREWSSRVSKPTLNLYLFDIRENLRLRGAEQYRTVQKDNGTAEVRRNPVRMDLRYLMTAWVKEAEDEHFLLGSALLGLLRNPFLPDDLLEEQDLVQNLPAPLDIATFPPELGPVDKFSELWGVLDNEMRPGILLTATISMDPYKPMVFSQVRTSERRFVQSTRSGPTKSSGRISIPAKSPSKTYWTVAGTIRSDKYDPAILSMILVEKNYPIEIAEGGRFTIQGVGEGEYHIDILYNSKVLKRQTIQVPSSLYEIQV